MEEELSKEEVLEIKEISNQKNQRKDKKKKIVNNSTYIVIFALAIIVIIIVSQIYSEPGPTEINEPPYALIQCNTYIDENGDALSAQDASNTFQIGDELIFQVVASDTGDIIETFSISFGDGVILENSGQNLTYYNNEISHVYGEAGLFTVVLTVSDDEFTSRDTIDVFIQP